MRGAGCLALALVPKSASDAMHSYVIILPSPRLAGTALVFPALPSVSKRPLQAHNAAYGTPSFHTAYLATPAIAKPAGPASAVSCVVCAAGRLHGWPALDSCV